MYHGWLAALDKEKASLAWGVSTAAAILSHAAVAGCV